MTPHRARQRPYPEIGELARSAIERLFREARGCAPSLGNRIAAWAARLSPSGQPEEYFTDPRAVPALLLPCWLQGRIRRSPDVAFQSDLVYSTISGYYFIRIVDDLMDRHAGADPALLPALAFFHTRFQSAYFRHFPAASPFWEFFEQTWFAAAEAVHRDRLVEEYTLQQFTEIAAQKSVALKIPLGAVCYRESRTDLLPRWFRFYDVFACWHQMLDDLFDWLDDSKSGNRSYLLSEGERRKGSGEPFLSWLTREGFDWAWGLLENWMTEMRSLAESLESPELLEYLELRNNQTSELVSKLSRALDRLWALSTPQPPGAPAPG